MFVAHSEVHVFLLALVLGMVLIGVLLSPALFFTKRALESSENSSLEAAVSSGGSEKPIGATATTKSQKPQHQPSSSPQQASLLFGYPKQAVLLSAIFYFGAAIIVFGFIAPWVQAFLRENPFVWTFNFAVAEPRRLYLSLFWLVAIVLSILAFNLNGIYDEIAKKSSRIPLILVRKYFHVLAVVMFSPGYIFEVRQRACFGQTFLLAFSSNFFFSLGDCSHTFCSWLLGWPFPP